MAGSMTRDAIAKTIDKEEGERINVYCANNIFFYRLVIKKIKRTKKGKVSKVVLEKHLTKYLVETDRGRNNVGWFITSPEMTYKRRVSRVD